MGSRTRPLECLLLLALLLGGCGNDAEQVALRTPSPTSSAGAESPSTPRAPAIPAAAPVVVFLGDSLAAGMQLAAHEAFPAVLQRTLFEADVPFRLVNAGVSGNTTAAGLGRVDWLLAQDPDVVVIELGANDGFRGLSLAATEANLRAILEKVRGHGATPLLLGMKLPPNYGVEYASGFDALYRRIAEDTGVAFVPFFMAGVAGVQEMNLSDGIHPTAAGHRKLAANLEAALLRVLRR